VCVSALIVCESCESSCDCVCASLIEAYRCKRDLLEPDLLDPDTLYKACHCSGRQFRQGYIILFGERDDGGIALGALMGPLGFYSEANDDCN
jgi:hypothetical protein